MISSPVSMNYEKRQRIFSTIEEPRKKSHNTFRLFNEDCLNGLKKLKDNEIDFIATDPPYFLDGMDNDWSDSNLKKKAEKCSAIGGLPVGMKFDPMQGKRLQDFFYKVSVELLRVLKPGGFMVSFSQGRLFHRMSVAAEDAGFEVRDMLIWEHNGGQGKAFKQDHFVKKMKISEREKAEIIAKLQERKTPQLRPKFEPILLAQKPKDGTFVNNWIKWQTGLIKTDFEGFQTTLLKYHKPLKDEMIDHMTIKPVDLMERLIEIFSIEGQTILDPFLGSGTTAVASIKNNRNFVGFEIEKKYIEIATNRLKSL
jgi:site-specific DNA-methyltransferase (adenine-specific)